MKVLIASGVQAQLLGAAAEAAPEECCGLLLGVGFEIKSAVPARNVAADPTRNFEIDPAVLLRTHREARGIGKLRVLGVYHSHPNGRAEPSKTDAARAVDNQQLWLIIANGSVTAWATSPFIPTPPRRCIFGPSNASKDDEGDPDPGTSWDVFGASALRLERPFALHDRFHPIPLETF